MKLYIKIKIKDKYDYKFDRDIINTYKTCKPSSAKRLEKIIKRIIVKKL